MRKFPFFDLFNPGPIDTDRHLMFRLASCRTGMATNALTVINNESVLHKIGEFVKFLF